MMIDYHRRLVRRSDGDSYQPACSFEPMVILSSPLRTVGDSYHQRFNDTGGDKGVGDRLICSSDILQYFLLTNYE